MRLKTRGVGYYNRTPPTKVWIEPSPWLSIQNSLFNSQFNFFPMRSLFNPTLILLMSFGLATIAITVKCASHDNFAAVAERAARIADYENCLANKPATILAGNQCARECGLNEWVLPLELYAIDSCFTAAIDTVGYHLYVIDCVDEDQSDIEIAHIAYNADTMSVYGLIAPELNTDTALVLRVVNNRVIFW